MFIGIKHHTELHLLYPKEEFTKFRAILTRKRGCQQLQTFWEHEQASTRLNFVSNSSKGKILRAVKNFNGSFITPSLRLTDHKFLNGFHFPFKG